MKYFSIIYCDQCRDCIPYNYVVITVTLCLDNLSTAHAFWFRFSLKIFSCACLHILKYELSCIQWCGCTSGTRQHMLPVVKILTLSQQERVSSCFIYLIHFLPCWVSVTGMKVLSWRSAFVCKYRRFTASLGCQAASRMLVVCKIGGHLYSSVGLSIYVLRVVVQS